MPNLLIHESSPYLLQHAHNPVAWQPWGDAALAQAKKEDKIILVSIGYAACHWCHVMERESFENEEVAAVMNKDFINIKIDREERPDIDHIYMDAVQAMTGSGGWPLNVFLTPDAKPFYGGTYFPPVQAFGRASWTDVLNSVARSWTEKREEIERQASTLTEHLQASNSFGQTKVNILDDELPAFTKGQCDTIMDNIMAQADTIWGGFGKAPKFPQTYVIQYLLQYHYYTKNEQALQQALLSIDKMIQGGIYDQAGGGFSRYSTDTEWLAPHFEKMLYDNALILSILCDAYQTTKKERYAQVIRQTIDFLTRELMDKDGGFYAALDADSEGVEGKFYVWQKEEIEQILKEDAPLFCKYFDVSEAGNWEHVNILRTLKNAEYFAKENNIEVSVLQQKMDEGLHQLLAVRNTRVRPITDDKILLGWNAMMVTALCKASAALGDEDYKDLAITTMNFLIQQLGVGENKTAMCHTYKNGTAKVPAFVDDYAAVIQACINLQEITSDTRWLLKAKEMTQYVMDNFEDDATGFLFFTDVSQTDVILRKKEVYDGATPSGNSVMLHNLVYLSIAFNEPVWHQKATALLTSLSTAIIKYPTSFGIWASAILAQAYGIDELAIVGEHFAEKRKELLKNYLPHRILQAAKTANNKFPLLAGKENEKTLIYLCKQYACKAPVDTIAKLLLMTNSTA